jgi:hypothetical protein
MSNPRLLPPHEVHLQPWLDYPLDGDPARLGYLRCFDTNAKQNWSKGSSGV